MATIQTSIRLTDGMSPALQSMNRALNIVLNSFESMQRASGKAIDTKSIQTARQELSKAQLQFDKIEQEINQNTSAQTRFNNSVRNGTSAADGLWSKIKGIAATYLGIQSVKGIIGLADEMTMTTARLDLTNDGLQSTAELNDKIYQSAMRSRASVTGMADAVAKLAARAGNIFKSKDETIAFTETLNKMFVIAGASQQEMASATLQLTQALGSCVLRGDEFNAVFESAPNIMQAVADYMNVPIGKLRELAEDGKISARVVKNAMFSAAHKVNEQFATMPYTWAQVWTTIKNHTVKEFRPLLEAIGKITSSQRFIQFANGVANAISKIAIILMDVFNLMGPVLGGIFDGISSIYNFFVDNWSFISPVIWGIIAAMTFYKVAILAVKGALWACAVVEGIIAFAKTVHAAHTAMATGATFAQTAAQYGLNAALLACPITWIIGAIILLIVIVYLAVAAVNHFAGTSVSAAGIIAGTFAALGAFIYNIVAYMWNWFASIAEFFANVFKNPVYSCKKLFVNFATNILDLCTSMTQGWDDFATSFANAIIKAINKVIEYWNKFIDMLPDSVTGALGLGKGSAISERVSITSDVNNLKATMQNWLGEQPSDYWEAPKMQMKGIKDSFDSGYNWGAKTEEKVKNLDFDLGNDKLNKLLNDVKGLGDLGGMNDVGKALSGGLGNNPALDGIAKDIGRIADNTSSIAASDEELSLMRDLAEREAINRYTLSNLKIEMKNNNTIKSGMDLDKIVDHLQRKVYEGVVATAEGVHF